MLFASTVRIRCVEWTYCLPPAQSRAPCTARTGKDVPAAWEFRRFLRGILKIPIFVSVFFPFSSPGAVESDLLPRLFLSLFFDRWDSVMESESLAEIIDRARAKKEQKINRKSGPPIGGSERFAFGLV